MHGKNDHRIWVSLKKISVVIKNCNSFTKSAEI